MRPTYDIRRLHPLAGKRVYVPHLREVDAEGNPVPVRVADWWPRLVGEPLDMVWPWTRQTATVGIERDYVKRMSRISLLLAEDPPVAVRLGRTMERTDLVHPLEILGVLDEPQGRRSGVSFWLCTCGAGYVDAGHPCPFCGGAGRRVVRPASVGNGLDEWREGSR